MNQFAESPETYNHSLETAFEAEKNQELFAWVQEYIRGEGRNSNLADILLDRKPLSVKLVDFPLDKLNRIMGPEKEMKFVESQEKWETRVTKLMEVITSGKKVPPLIVTDFWDPLSLSDGSHRHEALKRCGFKKYWTVFFYQ